MKRTLLYLNMWVMTFILTAFSTSAWATAGDAYYTLNCTTNAKGSAYATYYDVTINNMTWNAPGNQTFDGYWRIGGKSISNEDRTITAKSAMNELISKVTINHNGVSNSNLVVNSVTMIVAKDNNFSNIIETVSVTPTIKAGETDKIELVPTDDNWPSGAYYKFVFNLSNSKTSNYGLDLTSIEFTEGSSDLEKATISCNPLSQLWVGLGNNDYEVTYDGDGTLTASSSDSNIATASLSSDGIVTISPIAEGSAKITISAPSTDTYQAATYSYDVTVREMGELDVKVIGGKAGLDNIKGCYAKGLGTDYAVDKNIACLKFDGTGDEIIFAIAHETTQSPINLCYVIKGNGYGIGSIFDVEYSTDGRSFSNVKKYTELAQKDLAEMIELPADAQFVRFVYSDKATGNVGLGNILITDKAPYSRQTSEGEWGTICLAKGTNAGHYAGATFYSVVGYAGTENDPGYIVLEEEKGDLIPYRPYIFCANNSEIKLFNTIENTVEGPDTKYNGLIGCIDGSYVPDGCYVIFNNKVTLCGENCQVAENRAYLDTHEMSHVDTTESAVKMQIFNTTTGINSVDAASQTSTIYNLTGQQMSRTQKGIYIVNGKKVIR